MTVVTSITQSNTKKLQKATNIMPQAERDKFRMLQDKILLAKKNIENPHTLMMNTGNLDNVQFMIKNITKKF